MSSNTSILSNNALTRTMRTYLHKTTPAAPATSTATTKTNEEPEVCAICWNNLPLRPKKLHCGHEFCRTCIYDLKKHSKTKNVVPCCPMCRGPLEKPCGKRLWKEFKAHERAAMELTRQQRLQIYLSESTRLLVEARAEYQAALQKLEDCLALLQDSKQIVRILCKMIDILPLAKPMDYKQPTIELLEEIIRHSDKPVPKVHFKLARMLHCQEEDLLHTAIPHYERVLEIANAGVKSSRQAKKLRGKAHYGLALCFHRLGNYKRAAKEYDASEQYNDLLDCALAAESHYFNGNFIKALEYASIRSNTSSIETVLLLARICKGYFLSSTKFRMNAFEYQAVCEIYRKCVRQAQDMATGDAQRRECIEHLEFLVYLQFPTKKSAQFLEDPTERETEDDETSVEL